MAHSKIVDILYEICETRGSLYAVDAARDLVDRKVASSFEISRALEEALAPFDIG